MFKFAADVAAIKFDNRSWFVAGLSKFDKSQNLTPRRRTYKLDDGEKNWQKKI